MDAVLNWTTDPAKANLNTVLLKPKTTYYLNYHVVGGPSNATARRAAY